MTKVNYKVINTGGAPIKHWTNGVLFEEEAKKQLIGLSQLPFIYKHLAVMPDVHAGKGSTIGTVLATHKAIIPAAVGVDLGCGMMACKTSLMASDLPDNLWDIRCMIESMIPHGSNPKNQQLGSWGNLPDLVFTAWSDLESGFLKLCDKYPRFKNSNNINHLGTLGGGNHFVEICIDEDQSVWFMLHSGSRGIGNLIGRTFIELAKKDMERYFINLPDKDMAYLPEGSEHYADYLSAVRWAQHFAMQNRIVMMCNMVGSVKATLNREFETQLEAVNCHHNYVSFEEHFGQKVIITRKGAVSARKDELGIIPGSMGAKSLIVRGLGNVDSFHSCSHGAGRVMSRTTAKRLISEAEHKAALSGVECNNSVSTLDETPAAYKNIDDVMAAQSDLVEIVHTLKQVLCIKG
jgi:tRNA-splicing ligase RtcB